MELQRHPRSLILAQVDSVCDFLLVIKSNLCPILLRFRDIAGFRKQHPTPIPPEFWGVPLGLDCRSWDPKLIIRVITFEQTQLYAHGTTTSQTDRQMDDLR